MQTDELPPFAPLGRGSVAPTTIPLLAQSILLAVLSAAGLWIVYAVFVQTAPGQLVDGNNVIGERLLSDRVQHDLSVALAAAWTGAVLVATPAIVLAALARRDFRAAFAVVTLVLGANLTTQALKVILDRPSLVKFGVLGYLASGNTLPSGHETLALSLAIASILVVPTRFRALAAIVGVIFAALVGVAVIANGWHHPSDVVAAALVTTAWASIALPLTLRDRTGHHSVGWNGLELILGAGGVTALAGGLAILAWTAVRLGRPEDISLLTGGAVEGYLTFVGGLLFASGAIVVCYATMLRQLAGVQAAGRGGGEDRVDPAVSPRGR